MEYCCSLGQQILLFFCSQIASPLFKFGVCGGDKAIVWVCHLHCGHAVIEISPEGSHQVGRKAHPTISSMLTTSTTVIFHSFTKFLSSPPAATASPHHRRVPTYSSILFLLVICTTPAQSSRGTHCYDINFPLGRMRDAGWMRAHQSHHHSVNEPFMVIELGTSLSGTGLSHFHISHEGRHLLRSCVFSALGTGTRPFVAKPPACSSAIRPSTQKSQDSACNPSRA
ncbi:hypothetical protein K438DRAFT_103941 [Mycena galopus ATCC 62051]|nr:hypothetical protein K438DRAFT_103941 [Mycena galopus ATCC 62051]